MSCQQNFMNFLGYLEHIGVFQFRFCTKNMEKITDQLSESFRLEYVKNYLFQGLPPSVLSNTSAFI